MIKDISFQLNTYYMCMSNNGINWKQCNIYWYVKIYKVSHMEQEVINDIINKVEVIFSVLTVKKGNAHQFLGMKIRYLMNKRVSINMK